jgi:hypothetical protein
MASGGKRKGAGRPKGSKNKERTAIEVVIEKQRRQIEAGVEIAKEEILPRARRFAAHALEAIGRDGSLRRGSCSRAGGSRDLLKTSTPHCSRVSMSRGGRGWISLEAMIMCEWVISHRLGLGPRSLPSPAI